MPISHPFRLAGDRVALVAEGSDRLASEIAASVLSVIQAERGLAPQWGIPDPIGAHVHEVELSGWIEVNEPDIRVQSIEIVRDMDGSVAARVRATWAGRN